MADPGYETGPIAGRRQGVQIRQGAAIEDAGIVAVGALLLVLGGADDVADGTLNSIAGVGDDVLERIVRQLRQDARLMGEILVDADLGEGWGGVKSRVGG